MRRFRVLCFFILIALSSLASAQSLSVESFRLLESDLTANTYGTMERDQNGDVAAIIKVVTSETGFVFDGGMMGIVKTVQKTGEIWVYVPHSIRKITISHQQLGILRDYYFPVPVEKARTYELKLSSGVVRTIVEQSLTTQYVVFKVQPSNALVFIDEDEPRSLDSEGMLAVRLKRGTHSYRVTAASYMSESGVIDVQSEKINKEIELRSSTALLTVTTSKDAEVWINDALMGTGNWTGELEAGVYLVEARKPSHRTIRQEVTLSLQDNRTLSLGEPIPIYGIIDIQSTPFEADVYIDGKSVGQTPLVVDNVLIGEHKIGIEKRGYRAIEQAVTIEEGSTLTRSFTLQAAEGSAQKTVQSTTQVLGPTQMVQANPEYVDLGLSVKWATFNIGATKPEEFGYYYAWGETERKFNYNWKTYKWCNGSSTDLTKYINNLIDGAFGYADYKLELDIDDDVAHATWGGDWRMPTIAEWRELLNKCDWQLKEQNGVLGFVVRGKKSVYRTRSIFIPLAGVYEGSKVNNVGVYGLYRSSTLDKTNSAMARNAYLTANNQILGFDYRFGGLPVRAVHP